MKTFEVLVTAYRTVIIKAESSEEAEQTASEECHDFEWDVDTFKVEKELVTPEDIASAKRHGAVELDRF